MSTDVGISVIISTWNRASYLPECLRSLAAQHSELSHEVIVVDNGSDDATPELLARWCSEHPEFRTTREEQPGISRGMNAGIRMAKAPLLLFTDDDVVVPPDWIHAYAAFFSRHPMETIVAGGPMIPVPEDLGDWPSWLDTGALIDIGTLDHEVERELHPPDYVFGNNMAVPATVFGQLGLWNEDLGYTPTDRSTFEDTELQDRVWAAGGSVWFCPDAPIQHRVPRARSSPGPLLQNAFARGRNDFWKQVGASEGDDLSADPHIGFVRGLAVLAWNLLAEGVTLIWFRARRRRASLERARRAAWRTGQSFETLRPGRDRTRRYGRIGRVTFLVRRALFRLAPRIPVGPGG